MTENQNFVEKPKTVCNIGSFGLWFRFFVVGLVSACTVGLATPWMIVWIVGYICNNTTVDGKSIEYTCTGGKLFVEQIKVCLLTIITVGIYSFWVPARVLKFHIKYIHISEEY
ncbi:MAG: DUF898 domain-containing protein [Clostridia bacterium]|nr:DUF898 domain-containing protein [Clostridia bacterium]